LADRWLPRQFNKKSFPLIIPDKYIDPPAGMIINKLCSSASFIVIYCTDTDNNEYLLCRLVDFDNMGINPMLKYMEISKAITEKNLTSSIRVLKDNYRNLPPEDFWWNISLNELDTATLNFDTLTVLQTGKGNLSRTIRIQTNDSSAFYEIKLNNDHWDFIHY